MLLILSGASGVGKSTLCNHSVSTLKGVCLSVSYTTRPKRVGEEHGREYWFVDKNEFQQMIAQQAFLEYAEVYGNLYGTPRQELTQVQEQGIDVILDIDVQGARNVMDTVPDAVSVFLMPPSLEILQARLQARGTDDPKVIERRLQEAQSEMAHHVEYQYTVRNESLEQATREFESIILAERVRTNRLDRTWLEEKGLIRQTYDSEQVPQRVVT